MVYSLFLIIFYFCLVAADQYTKYLAIQNLAGNAGRVVIDGIINFTYVENKGAAWGIFSGRINYLSIVTILIGLFICYLLFNSRLAKKYSSSPMTITLMQIDFLLILAGAVGNLIDRLFNGYVVDFIQFDFIDFPVFNVADCYITVGAVLFIILYTFVISQDDFDKILKGKKAIKEDVSDDAVSH